MNSKVLIFTPRITSRNKFTFKLILSDILGLEYEITSNHDIFIKYVGPKFSYCRQAIGDEIFFQSTGLLFETGIVVQELNTIDWNGSKVFYLTHKTSVLPFDPFAASFFLVSRYEEYLPHIKDKHGRFAAQQSLAFQHGFLNTPIINHWALEILSILEKSFGPLNRKGLQYNFISTIDIDNAWAYQHKGFIRAGAGLFADASNLKFKHLLERLLVLFRFKQDPYDTYEYQIELIEKYKLKTIFFFLLGDFATFDRNVPYQNKHMQSLIKYIADTGEVGIHPSYASNNNSKKLQMEVHRLSNILHQEIHSSRQHFLKLNLPQTYHRLIECDITDDYTMGYAELPGFRASIASSFFFYDLDLEIETSLKIHPFAIMDGTLKDYMKVEPEKASEIINPLIDKVKAVNGTFISIWHNESFAENNRWKGWRKVYEDLIEKALPNPET
jgi:hypothetical protein